MVKRDLVVVGGGPAGMAAAIAAHEGGVKEILLIERDQYLGGLLNQCIHTGFGLDYFKEILTGPDCFPAMSESPARILAADNLALQSCRRMRRSAAQLLC